MDDWSKDRKIALIDKLRFRNLIIGMFPYVKLFTGSHTMQFIDISPSSLINKVEYRFFDILSYHQSTNL